MAGIKPQGPGIPLIRLNMQAPGSGHVAKIPRVVKWSNGASSARHPGSTQLVRDAAQLREMEIGGSRRSSDSILGNKSGSDDFSFIGCRSRDLAPAARAERRQPVHAGFDGIVAEPAQKHACGLVPKRKPAKKTPWKSGIAGIKCRTRSWLEVRTMRGSIRVADMAFGVLKNRSARFGPPRCSR